ncbi:MAG: hypothetical protein QG600_700 [Patescibacteria group bacterium]|nr:hypothetical protein [Patescibacteria group bacterium]
MATKTTKTTAKKVTPKSPAKTTTRKKVTPVEISEPVVEKKSASTKRSLPSIRVRRSHIIVALLGLALIAGLYLLRNYFIVATVNGQPITRIEYYEELERLSGKQALNSIVTKNLILQEAKKQNVSVTNEEIDNEISTISKNLEAQGQKLDAVLTLQGLTMESLREQVSLQKLIEKMVGKDIKVTDKEVADYIAANQESLPEGTDEAQMKKDVSEQLRQQKLNDKVQEWLQKLQQEATVNYSQPQS